MSDPSPDRATYNLLFVCTGNTCRSPMAAALARHHLRARRWSHVQVASAGTSALAGSPASDAVVLVLREVGIDPGQHEAAELTPDTVAWADSILAMAPPHLAAVEAMGGAGKAALVTDFIEGADAGMPVVDPIGGSVDVYRETRDQLERAIGALLDRLGNILAP